MSDEIKVHVVKYPDRDNLVMRYVDPFTGRHVAKSARTADNKKATAWLPCGRRIAERPLQVAIASDVARIPQQI